MVVFVVCKRDIIVPYVHFALHSEEIFPLHALDQGDFCSRDALFRERFS